MISLVIPTLNAERDLPDCLSVLTGDKDEQMVQQIIVSDGGSTDNTQDIAAKAGCLWVESEKGRGQQLATGAQASNGEWLLFLHADTQLQSDWLRIVSSHIKSNPDKAAVFKFALSSSGFRPRFLEFIVGLRCRFLKLPYGDQGLLISREHYDQIGGFKPIPLMEDVDIIRRIGKRNLCVLPAKATTSAVRYERNGYMRRMMKNLTCLCLYFIGVPPERILQIYR